MNELLLRLNKFSVDVYNLTLKLRKDPALLSNINQLVRSSASPGANYGEAQSASSYKDFHNKIRISLKEMRETRYWLMYFNDIFIDIQDFNPLLQECEELCKILSAIALKTGNHQKPSFLPQP